MSSYAASSCTCSRKVSCASETSASCPTATLPPPRSRSPCFPPTCTPPRLFLFISPPILRSTPPPPLPPFNSHNARLPRHRRRRPSSPFIESAPEHYAFIRMLLLMRASDTSLG